MIRIKLLSSLQLCASLTTIVLATPTPHEVRLRTHPAWTLVGRAAAEAVVPVRIGLTQGNLDEGLRLFDDMTNYSSPNYGRWWTPERIRDFFAPQESDVSLVHAWLVSCGVNATRISRSSNKQWLQLDAPITELENLLNAEYYEYQHSDGRLAPASLQYHVPAHLSHIIDYVTPGISLGRTSAGRNKAKRDSGNLCPKLELNGVDACDLAVTPACIRAMYNITYCDTAVLGNDLGLFETLLPGNANHYSPVDLDDFFRELYPIIPQGTRPKEHDIDGSKTASGPIASVQTPECDLDIQVAYPVIWPQQIRLFEVGDSYYTSTWDLYGQYFDGLADDFLYAIDGSYCHNDAFGVDSHNPLDPLYPDSHPGGYRHPAQCGVFKAPNVISTSYGDTELDVGTNFLRRQCLEYMKLGMQGVSVLTASGDNGVDCDVDNNRIFAPSFPATCPYVTAVGGTAVDPDELIDAPQIATTLFGSGGGFSNIFPRPEYQKQAVARYLDEYVPPYPSYSTLYNESVGAHGGVYNSGGRAFPDLAAVGQNIAGWYNGACKLAQGTSASSPLFGAILTRINAARLQQGKSTVGFVNPVLYAHQELFTDITVGNNTNVGSTTGCNITSPGFFAAPGWDPVTGMGTPRIQAMLDFWTR